MRPSAYAFIVAEGLLLANVVIWAMHSLWASAGWAALAYLTWKVFKWLNQ